MKAQVDPKGRICVKKFYDSMGVELRERQRYVVQELENGWIQFIEFSSIEELDPQKKYSFFSKLDNEGRIIIPIEYRWSGLKVVEMFLFGGHLTISFN